MKHKSKFSVKFGVKYCEKDATLDFSIGLDYDEESESHDGLPADDDVKMLEHDSND